MSNILHTGLGSPQPRLCVFGVGGAGANAVDTMIAAGLGGVDFVVANTDAQALNGSSASRRVQLGRIATEGLGAGSDPAVGAAAAKEAIDEIGEALEGAHMCFITAGMGGGTGTGAASIIAAAARARGVLTVAVVTLPFAFEGRRRAAIAQDGIAELEKHVDTLIVIPNQNLFRISGPETTFRQAFRLADAVLEQGVRGITDLIATPGLVNVDFADIRSIMGCMGNAMMASGEASGPNRAIEAAEMAICNPLLEGELKGARGLIISIGGGEDLRLMEIDAAARHIKDMADPDADIIWGSVIDPALDGRMRISIVATGLQADARRLEPLRVNPALVGPAPTTSADIVAEASSTPPKGRPNDDVRACTDDLLAMFLPEQLERPLIDGAAPGVREAASAGGVSLFQRMTMLARGVPEIYAQPLPREPDPRAAASCNPWMAGSLALAGASAH